MKLECKKVSKQFGANTALSNVDFSVESGEIRALLGGNGSGKSTLTKLIGGALSLTGGSMELNGEPYAPKSPVDAKRKGVIFTSQELSLFENLSVEENMAICELSVEKRHTANKEELTSRAHRLLEEYHLERLAAKSIREMGANEQYLVEFMKAVFQKPDILIIDEITSALYKEDVKIVDQVIRKLKAEGKIILMITHRMPEIMNMCDTVTVLRNGVVIDTLATDAVTETQLISKMTGLNLAETTEDFAHVQARAADGAATETLFSVDHLTLSSYGKSISLEVKAGEIIGIAGLQGQGQSEIVRQLFGLDRSAPSLVRMNGRELLINSPAAAIRQGVAFISGDRSVEGTMEDRSIAENLEIVSRIMMRSKIDHDKLLHRFHVKYQNKRNLITSLSGGNQQKVVLARWLATKPRVILADDPTKGIDVQARHDLHKTLVEIAAEGSAVLMVSSDDEELVNLAGLTDSARVIVVYEGVIVKTLRGKEITAENIAAASANLQGE